MASKTVLAFYGPISYTIYELGNGPSLAICGYTTMTDKKKTTKTELRSINRLSNPSNIPHAFKQMSDKFFKLITV